MTNQGGSFPYPVTGINTGYDSTTQRWPPRKEIETFFKDDPKQGILFILATDELCRRPMNHTLSYFQLGGIHGLPQLPWPRATGPGSGFYCTHGNLYFITWHRVYMLCYEQALHDIIMKYVNPNTPDSQTPIPKPQREDWRRSAETWRLPYWDFALRRDYNNNGACIPRICMIDGDPLKAPSASGGIPPLPGPTLPPVNNNPFYAFKYPLNQGETLAQYGIVNIRGLPLGIQERTVRHAPPYTGDSITTQAWTKGISDINNLKTTFWSATAGWRADLLSCLTDTDRFNQFSMGDATSDAEQVPNLEGIHGAIHVYTGGAAVSRNGNMSSVPCAGLDPIFFLYHAGIDRLAALWQAGHPSRSDPNNWLPRELDGQPLHPFLDATGKSYWISRNTRDVNNLGYRYEDTKDIRDYQSLVAVSNRLYGSTTSGGLRGPGGGPDIPLLAPDYVFSVTYEPQEIGPFRLFIYLLVGGTEYSLGDIVNFVAPPGIGCENCEENERNHKTTTDSTIMTEELKDLYRKHILTSFETDYIEEYLAKHLTWKLVSIDSNQDLDLSVLPSLKCAVTKREHKLREGFDPDEGAGRGPGGGTLPPKEFSGAVPLRGITSGKPSGLGEGEDLHEKA